MNMSPSLSLTLSHSLSLFCLNSLNYSCVIIVDTPLNDVLQKVYILLPAPSLVPLIRFLPFHENIV